MTAVLGIDVGLSAVRAAVVDADARLLAHARCEHSPRIAAGRAEQNARDWVAGMWSAGREAVRSAAAPIDAIAVSALGPAPVLVDGGGQPLGPALLFGLDTRAESQRAVLGVSHDHALPKLMWWHDEHPQLTARARHALDATGYLVLALTGAAVMDEVTSDAYRAPGAMSPVPLPDPIAATAIAGSLQAEAAGELGLPAGIPVAAGTIDSYADVAGTGVAIGDGVLLLGSTLVIYAVAAEPTRLPGLDCERYPGPGVLVGGCTNAAGLALAWARRELGAADAAEVAALPPGAGGLLALPYLAGERTPIADPLATGLIVGLRTTTTAAQMQRAILDGVAFSALDHADLLAAHGLTPATWRVTGGGVRDEALLQAVADALAAPLAVMPHAGHAIGPAALALRAAGCAYRPEAERTVLPRAEASATFHALLPRYRDAYRSLAPVMHALGSDD